MSKVRVIGPRDRMQEVLSWLQRFGLVHLSERPPTAPGVGASPLTGAQRRRIRQLQRIADDADVIISELDARRLPEPRAHDDVNPADLAAWARALTAARKRLDANSVRSAELREELELIGKYREFYDAFAPILRDVSAAPRLTTHAVIVPAAERRNVQSLIDGIEGAGLSDCIAAKRVLRSGDLALLVVLPSASAERFEELFGRSRLPELSVPSAFGGRSLAEAIPLMTERLAAIPEELDSLAAERAATLAGIASTAVDAAAASRDLNARMKAQDLCSVTDHAFALDGWIPAVDSTRLVKELHDDLGDDAAAAILDGELWTLDEAPVDLHNPRLLRPFEAIVRMMPLPRYGSIDPTPYVAIFFPAIFGLIVGDMAYGIVIAATGLILHRRSRPGSVVRTVSEIMGPSAGFTIIFGFLYGEFLGDAGRRYLGMHHVLVDREESVVALLFVALGLGLAHVALGLVLGTVSRWRSSPRHAVGSAVTLLMVGLLVVALLATARVLPESMFTPALIALIIAVPVLIAAEGVIAPIEFLATLGNVLSYARVMALGTAGVMLAVVANQMVGAIGSTVVGILLALLFHIVNFAIALFSPTIHVLRLHYVEFFGKFYSPGGRAYRPFRQWRPNSNSVPT